jgi:hypothetical protein
MLPRNRQFPILIPDREHRILWPAPPPFTRLFPLCQNQPRRNNRKISRKIKAERITIRAMHVGKQPPGFHQFIAFRGSTVVTGLLAAIARVHRDFARAPARPHALRLHAKRARHHPYFSPGVAHPTRFKAVVNMNLSMPKNQEQRHKTQSKQSELP